MIALLDHLRVPGAVVGGTGLGGTIALRAGLAFPSWVRAVVVISAEDIEDDDAKLAETALMDRFAEPVRADGIEAAWELFLPHLQPLIGNPVRSAIPRADPGSVAAAAAIGRDRSFDTLDELNAIEVPVLIVPGADERHPAELAERMSATNPHETHSTRERVLRRAADSRRSRRRRRPGDPPVPRQLRPLPDPVRGRDTFFSEECLGDTATRHWHHCSAVPGPRARGNSGLVKSRMAVSGRHASMALGL
ncbi:hypothetical protein [Rhodococcus sp. A14]|uniref:hypothetical protein n=1 Tax=Rhodococcus sp. A14 TaxID=1194106 RepID=UPI001F0D8C5A